MSGLTSSSSGGGFMSFLKDTATIAGAAGAAVGGIAPLIMKDDEPEFKPAQQTTLADMEAEAAAESESRRKELLRRRGVQSTIRTSGVGVQGVDVSAPTFGVLS